MRRGRGRRRGRWEDAAGFSILFCRAPRPLPLSVVCVRGYFLRSADRESVACVSAGQQFHHGRVRTRLSAFVVARFSRTVTGAVRARVYVHDRLVKPNILLFITDSFRVSSPDVY